MLLSKEEVFRLIDAAVQPLPVKPVPPLEAVGCAVAEDIIADQNYPNFASSAMDGIAFCLDDLTPSYPQKLKIQGVIPAGQPVSEPVKPGHAFRIMTGAALPQRADSIVIVEDVIFEGDNVILQEAPASGQHIRPAGNDIRKGECVFSAGYVFKPLDAGILSTLGLTEVTVQPKPAIALLATGSEIRPPGAPLEPGQIYNANDTTLLSLLRLQRIDRVDNQSPLLDDPAPLTERIAALSQRFDLLITSGAVSMGSFDYIPTVVEKLGGKLLFHKSFVKPGKPTLVAQLGRCWLLALPGNPVSVAVTFHLYGKRIISRLMGKSHRPRQEKAVVKEAFPVSGKRFQVVGASLERVDGRLEARVALNYSSGRMSALKNVDGFILIEGGSRTVPAGAVVDIEWL